MREASGVASNLTALPGGGGGVSPLGDRFRPDLVKGTGNYQVPLHFPQGPNELRPALSLTYSTGYGNGPFGLGWQLNPLRIERRTDRGVPGYGPDDQFVLAGGGVLVDVGGGRYRPEADTSGWMIQRVGDHWQIRDGSGRTLILGRSPASREVHPDGLTYAWCLEEESDAAGNTVTYDWSLDGGVRYLDVIRYSIFRIAFGYEPRQDHIRSGRAGYMRTVRRRATTIDLHCDRETPSLLRTYELAYVSAHNLASLLTSVTLTAERDAETASMPALTFTYTGLDPHAWQVAEPTASITPPSISDAGTQFVDLNGDGLPDLLAMSGGRAQRWDNLGGGHFGGPVDLNGLPSSVSLEKANVAFADLNGNGRVDLFSVDEPLQLAFQADGHGGFAEAPVIFASTPTVGLADPETRLLDTDGDGVVDLYRTDRNHHLWFRHDPATGFETARARQRIADLAEFPDVSFADRGVAVADMTGDGLRDIVEVQSGYVVYWPNPGNGSWGRRVVMATPPGLPEGFGEDRLQLIDVDGSGSADIVRIDEGRIVVWFNQMGNGFSPPTEIPIGIPGDGAVTPVDVYGDGRPALVWELTGSTTDGAGFVALRFNPETAPYLMSTVDNGMGGVFEMRYSTSSAMRALDAGDGRPWTGELPMVVHVLEAIIEIDTVADRRAERHIRYHDGVYDGPQRDFRGFKEVTVLSLGDASVPGSRQEVTHFVGDPHLADLAERERQQALVGAVEATRTYKEADGGWQLTTTSQQTWDVRIEHDDDAGRVYFPFLRRIETVELGDADPDLIDVVEYGDHDEFANPRSRIRTSRSATGSPAPVRSEERWTFVRNETDWLVKLPSRMEFRDGDGLPHMVQIRHYDGTPHSGLPEGEATTGLITRGLELRLLDSRLPAGFAADHDLAALGFVRAGSGDTAGWYAVTNSVRRDSHGNVVEHRGPLGDDVTIAYDADGVYPETTTDAMGRTTATTFEPRSGEPASTVFPDGRRVVQEFDPLGRLQATLETDDAGVLQMTKCWFFDASLPVSLTSVAPRTAGHRRQDFVGADLSAVSGVAVSRVYYDGFGQETVQITRAPDTPTGERRFSATGQAAINPRGLTSVQHRPTFVPDLSFVTPPSGTTPGAQHYLFDHKGQIADSLGPGGERFRTDRDTFTVTQYDAADAGPMPVTAATTRPPAPGPARRIETFDPRGRNISVTERATEPTSITTRFELTIDGKIRTISDRHGTIVEYGFAGPGDPVSVTHRDAGTRTYLHDAAGRLVERGEPDGSTTIFTNDELGRLIRIAHRPTDGAPEQTMREIHFDSDPELPDTGRFLHGRIARVADGTATIAYSYTPGGRARREDYTLDGESLTLDRSYDLQGSVTRIEYPDGAAVDYRLDDSGSVVEIPGFVGAVHYDPQGTVTSYLLGNGVEVTHSRDPDSHRLGEIAATRNGATLRNLRYDFDDLGAIAGVTDTTDLDTEHHEFQYDGLYRLTAFERRAGGAGGPTIQAGAYAVDDIGNLRRLQEADPVEYQFADPLRPGRITSVTPSGGGQSPVRYDARGQIRRFGQLRTIEYDPLGRAIRFVKDGGLEVRLGFDHEDRRILKEVEDGATTTRVRYVTGIFERHATHDLRHVFFGKQLVSTVRVDGGAEDAIFYVADHQGTLLCATDPTGAVVSNERMSPFGSSWGAQGGTLNRFLGRVADEETGLVHLGARFYSPHLGRFISVDWYAVENPDKSARLPQSFHLYAYALNNPLAFKDPSGLFIFIIAGVLAAIAIIAIVATAVAFTVGFVAGLIYGLTHDQGWGSLLTALETALLTTVGMWLGAATGFLVGGPLGAIIGGAMGGMNGLISGMHGVYDWGSWQGWAAFLSDSTWGLLGTSLGNIVHLINVFWPDSNYRHDLSHRQNRHVYEGGFRLKEGFAFSQGNVISNAGQSGKGINASFISDHEELHIWQSRIFGPLFQLTYVVWGVGGFIVGTIVWLTDTDQDWGSLVETAAYYDNPFEYWAYKNDHNNWPPAGANTDLTW